MSLLKKTLLSGILILGISKYSKFAILLIINAILARLLSPKEFGIVAIITIFGLFFNILSEFGIGPAIIQNKKLNKVDIKSIFSFTILLGFSLSILFFFSASLISKFYGEPKLLALLKLYSISVIFSTISIIPIALKLKDKDFKTFGIISVATQLASGIIAILLALNGFGVYSLIFKSILDSVFTFLSFYLLNPISITAKIQISSLLKVSKFSIYQFLFNLINFISRNLDNLLIGKYFGPLSLGYYEKSYQLMMLPIQSLTQVISPVLQPLLSEYQENREFIFKAYLKIVRILALIGFPLSIFLFYSAQELIVIIFGNQWYPSIPIFKILSLTVGVQIIMSSSGAIFQSSNQTKLLFITGFINAITITFAVLYGVFVEKSLIIVAKGLVFSFSFNFILTYVILIRLVLGGSLLEFFRVLIFPLILSVILIISLHIVSQNLIGGNVFTLFIKMFIASFLFVLAILFSPSHRLLVLNIFIKKNKHE